MSKSPEEFVAQTEEQTASLQLWMAYKAQGTTDLREQLILQYAPLVNKVVGRMGLSPDGSIEWNDLINYGMFGLIDAIERFELERGVTFATFASLRIRGAVLDALRQFDPLGRQARRRVRQAKEAIQQLTARLGRVPEDQEVATEIELTLEQYHQVLQDASFIMLSLDQPLQGGDDEQKLRLADLIEDPNTENIMTRIEQAELHERLIHAIQSLPQREQILLSLYYYDDLTMREVATVMDISQTRVCQLHARALLTLKALLAPMAAEEKAAPKPSTSAAPPPPSPRPTGRDPSTAVVDRRRTAYRVHRQWSTLAGDG